MRICIQRYTLVLLGLLVISAMTVFLSTTSHQSAIAQPTTYSPVDGGKELEEKIKQFFEEILLNPKSSKAFEDLFRSSQFSTVSGTPTVSDMISRLDEIKEQFGDFKSYEKIDEKPIGKNRDLVIIRYLMKCESYPVVWTFTYYRRPIMTGTTSPLTGPMSGQWALVGLRFDTNLDVLVL